MLDDTPHLILPCETRFREFDAKLLLACHAAERGWRAIVGSMKVIDQQAARWPRGVYISKSVTKRKLVMFGLLPKLGHILTAWDEEGLVYASPEVYRATKVDPRSLNAAVRLFAWGEANASAWRGHPDFAGRPISATGNPRADLLRPELRGYFAEEAQRLTERHGDFILINTNFSRMNHFMPGQSWHRQLVEDGGGRIVSDDDPRLGLAAHKQVLFEHFLAMAPAVARRFPERKLILRPHPSESPDIWRQVLAECPNAEVIYEGNATAWLMAAAGLVHNGCTTAVESFLLGRPAIAYQPAVSEAYDHALPNGLSVASFSLEELLERLSEMLAGDTQARHEVLAARRDLARQHVASYDGPSACERILEVLDEVLADYRGDTPSTLDQITGRIGVGVRRVVTRTINSLPGHRNSPAYLSHMFPLVSHSEVLDSVQRYGRLLGRFEGLRVETLDRNVFAISRDRPQRSASVAATGSSSKGKTAKEKAAADSIHA
jgi:surface carbohydrate biosynthesis protein